MGFDYEKVEKAWFKPKKDTIKVNLDLKGIKNLENYITDLEQNRYVLDELEKWLNDEENPKVYYDWENKYDYIYTDDLLAKIQELKKKECR